MKAMPYSRIKKVLVGISWFKKASTIDKLDSPTLFSFYKDVVQSRSEPKYASQNESTRHRLEQDHSKIQIEDHGAGSFSNTKEKTKTVSQIAKSAVSSKHKCTLLHNIVRHFKVRSVLELGTSLGIAAQYIRAVDPKLHLTTVEGDRSIHTIAKNNFSDWCSDIRSMNSTFDVALKKLATEGATFDLIYIDGGHRSDMIKEVMSLCGSIKNDETIFIIDDIYWSKDMSHMWEELKEDSAYNVAIDLWYFGILYKSDKIKEQIDVKMTPIDRRWTFGFFR